MATHFRVHRIVQGAHVALTFYVAPGPSFTHAFVGALTFAAVEANDFLGFIFSAQDAIRAIPVLAKLLVNVTFELVDDDKESARRLALYGDAEEGEY